jgi:nitrite reductase (NO-forming)
LIDIGPMPPGGEPGGEPAGAPGSRSHLTERHVLALGLGVSASFVVAAMLAAGWAAVATGTSWAALHLALAGAAMTAIGAFMPHFAVTLAGTRPAPAMGRLLSIAAIAVGGAAAVTGVVLIVPWLALVGAGLVVTGLAGVAAHTFAPMRDPLARRHPIVALAYGVALAELAAGALLGGLAGGGIDPVVAAWARLRPAHAWLTLFGGVSMTIFGTLVYLAPTVVGARIRPSAALLVATAGFGLGPLMTVGGFAADLRPLTSAGMAALAVGSIAQIGYVVDVARRRGRFTSEHDWRRVAVWHLGAGTGWFALASIVAAVRSMDGTLAGWSLGDLAAPLVAGWMLQELIGSWTHLVPSVTPGGPARHARQRRLLAVAGRTRVVSLNVGIGALWAGIALDAQPLAVAGGLVLGVAVVASVVLLAGALLARTHEERHA